MNKPKISWYTLEDIDGNYEYSPKKTCDLDGSYEPNDTVRVKIQAWNNRLGSEDVEDVTNGRLQIYFKNYEDNYLLRLCKIKFDNEDPKPLKIDMDRGFIDIGNISGKANNGSELNTDNFIEFELLIGPLPVNLKSELKGLFLIIDSE